MTNKFKQYFQIIYNDLWGWYHKLSQLENKLLKFHTFLENGKYEFISLSPSVIVVKHIRVEAIPTTLQTTISELWERTKNQSMLRNILAKTRNILERSNRYMVISNDYLNTEKMANAQVALIRPNGKILLFDVDKKIVFIKFSSKKVMHYNRLIQSAEMWGYAMIKDEIGKYFKLPNDKEPIGCFECQDLIDGEAFSQLSLSKRLRTVKEICLSSKKISENGKLSSTVSGFDIINEGFSLALLNVQLPEMLEYIKSRQEIIIEYSKSWKMVPSHCDLTAHNITIHNGHPILLDLSPHKVGFVPAFFIPMCLIHSEAKEYGRFDLVNAYLNHELDVELSFLFGKDLNDFDNKSLIDLLLAETLILAAIDSKIVPQNIHYWFDPIFKLMQTNLSDQVGNNSQIYN